jgi:signal transduction histidine kinase
LPNQHRLSYFFRSLPYLSRPIRFGIFFLALLLYGTFMIIGATLTGNRGLTPLFAIPVAIAAWLFKPRSACIAIIGVLFMQIGLNIASTGNIRWPFPMILVFCCAIIASIIEAFSIGFLRHTLKLADEAREQTQQAKEQLANSYQREQHLNVLKDQFLLNVSHELRTPLTEVRGYIDLLREHHQQLDPELQVTFLEHAAHGCEELELQVNNILEAMHAENQVAAPRLEALCIHPLIEDILQHTLDWQQPKHILQMDIPEELAVWADRQQLRQVVRNLLSNAFKYSPAQAPIVIQVVSEQAEQQSLETPPCIHISIQDAGPGIPPDEIPTLFHKFSRLKRDITGSVRGIGLGLYISKQFIEGMGGRIWVESTGIAGEGCRFCFALPRAPYETVTLSA